MYRIIVGCALFVILAASAEPSRIVATPAAKSILNQPQRQKPDQDVLTGLKSTDVTILRESFERQPLSNKIATAWALAHVGGPSALETLRKPLEEVAPDQGITGEDRQGLSAIVSSVAYLGQRSPDAAEYLRSMTRREKWKHTASWSFVDQAPIPPEILMPAWSFSALARTGRVNITQEVEPFLEQFSKEEVPLINGSIVDAVFYDWYIKKFGTTALNEIIRNDKITDALILFWDSPTGKPWVEWKRATERQIEVDRP